MIEESVSSLCKFCNSKELTFECKFPDFKNQILDVLSCNNCGSFLPQYNKKNITVEDQATLHENIWGGEPIDDWIAAEHGMLKMVKAQEYILGLPERRHLVVDLGAGRGNLSSALKKYGYSVMACEPSYKLYDMAKSYYGFQVNEYFNKNSYDFINDELINILPDYDKVTVYFWHVLEHIDNSKELLIYLLKQLKGKQVNILIQMPMLKSEYVFPEHHFLATPDWFSYLSDLLGLPIVDFFISKKTLFMTGFYSNNTSLEEFDLKRPFQRLSQTERYLRLLTG